VVGLRGIALTERLQIPRSVESVNQTLTANTLDICSLYAAGLLQVCQCSFSFLDLQATPTAIECEVSNSFTLHP